MWVLVQLSGWQQQLKMRLTIIERHGGSAEGWRCSITHSWRNHSLISAGSPTGRRERQQTLLDLSYCHRRRLMACLQGLGGKLFYFTTLSEKHGYALFCYSTIKDVPHTTSSISTWWSWYHFDSCRSATHACIRRHTCTHTHMYCFMRKQFHFECCFSCMYSHNLIQPLLLHLMAVLSVAGGAVAKSRLDGILPNSPFHQKETFCLTMERKAKGESSLNQQFRQLTSHQFTIGVTVKRLLFTVHKLFAPLCETD